MADLKIPNLNKKSDKFFFKKKLSLSRKSKSKLIKESFVMLFFSVLIIYFNFLIPNKLSILKGVFTNFSNLITKIFESLPYIYEICLAIFIIFSFIFSLILILGSFSRLLKVLKRKTKRVKF